MIQISEERVLEIRQSFLESVFGDGVRMKGSFSVTCPNCCSQPERQHKKKLSIRLSDGMHHCWICGIKGKTLKYTLKKYYPDKIHEYSRIFDEPEYNNVITSQDEVVEEIVRLPKNFIPLIMNVQDPDVIATRNYLYSRGLKNSDIYRWRFGTCTTGRFSRRVIMPSFDSEGTLNYFTARSIDDSGGRKYINCKASRKDIIFNELNLRWNEELTIVEGPFDLTKCNWNATALLGSTIDQNYLLFQKIVKNKTDVLLALDKDATYKRNKIADRLSSYGVNVRYLEYNDTYDDVGDMTNDVFNGFASMSREWGTSSRLSAKIKTIKSGSLF